MDMANHVMTAESSSGQVPTESTPIPIARSWGSSGRKPKKRTLPSPTSAIGGIAGITGRNIALLLVAETVEKVALAEVLPP